MKGKRYTTEDKIRILREADRGEKSIQHLCQEANISEVSFHRWKKQFGHMEINEARRLKELERENRELKQMLADSLLKNRVLAAGMCSGRAVCRYLGLARSTFSYRGRPATAAEEQLRKELLALSAKHPRYGYRRIAALLRRQGWRVGKRHIQRRRRDEGLRVPPTKRKLVRRGVSTGLPTTATHRNHVWSWDFIADATMRGWALRLLTILDEHTRECHVLWVDRAFKSAAVLHWLQYAIAKH